MKLSKTQLEVIALMKEGNTINEDWGLSSNVSICKRFNLIKYISRATFKALRNAKLIYHSSTEQRTNIYSLTPEGLAVDTTEK